MRLYRATLPFVLLAILALLFSVVSRPAPLEPELAGEPFDEVTATADARELLDLAPDRAPGSEGAAVAAELVTGKLESLEGGSIQADTFEGRYDGDEVMLENVYFELPGETEETVVIAAARDCDEGPCAATSAASTAALVGLARAFSTTHHRKSFLFASLDGSSAGAAGAERLAERLQDTPVTGAVVIEQAGVEEIHGRTVLPWSTGTGATSIQLVLTAEEAVASELGREEAPSRSTVSELVRLALPAGLGGQAPLVASGVDAVGLSGGGPLPPRPAADEELSPETLGSIGRTALVFTRALDAGPASLEHGPGSRIPLAGKLVPGWVLSLLALSLLLPIGATAGAAALLAHRAGQGLLEPLRWVLSCSLPFLAALLLASLLAWAGIFPAPPFPFDPAEHRLEIGPLLGLILLAAAVAGAFVPLIRLRPTPGVGAGAEAEAEVGAEDGAWAARSAACALGLFAGGMLAWLVNPYLALILGPTLHLWLWATRPELRGGLLSRLGLLAGGMLILTGVLALFAAQLGSGIASVPWQLLLLYTGGHFTLIEILPPVLLAGSAVAIARSAPGLWTDV